MSKTLVSGLRQFLKEVKYAPVEKVIYGVVPRKKQAEWIRVYHGWKRLLQPQIHQQLCQIVASHPNPRAVIVFAPGLDWERQLFQRPQQLAQAMAKRGALVFYTQIRPPEKNVVIKPVCDQMYVCAFPLEHFSILNCFFVYTLTWNRKYLLKFNQPRILYDYLDDISAFEGDPIQLRKDHRILLRDAQVVSVTARQLHEHTQETRPDSLLIPNGVDFEHFHASRETTTIPQDMVALCNKGRPIIGFYGAFASWFDDALVADLVKMRPDLNFVLIGPKHTNCLETSGLLGQANVYYLGAKPYAALPAYLACFDVAILPFKVNQVTQSTSPIKLFEYFAGGKPVVSTPLREVIQYPQVFLGKSSAEFSTMIDAAITASKDAATVRSIQDIARQNTWEMHAERILQAVEHLEPKSIFNQTRLQR